MKATKTEQVIQESKIILELSPKDARVLGALIGNFNKTQNEDFIAMHKQRHFNATVEDGPDSIIFELYNELNKVVGNGNVKSW